jgi:hypothetical protein
MRFELTVSVEVERIEGKFASRDEIRDNIAEALNDANPGTLDSLGADGTSSYEVIDWVVEDD